MGQPTSVVLQGVPLKPVSQWPGRQPPAAGHTLPACPAAQPGRGAVHCQGLCWLLHIPTGWRPQRRHPGHSGGAAAGVPDARVSMAAPEGQLPRRSLEAVVVRAGAPVPENALRHSALGVPGRQRQVHLDAPVSAPALRNSRDTSQPLIAREDSRHSLTAPASRRVCCIAPTTCAPSSPQHSTTRAALLQVTGSAGSPAAAGEAHPRSNTGWSEDVVDVLSPVGGVQQQMGPPGGPRAQRLPSPVACGDKENRRPSSTSTGGLQVGQKERLWTEAKHSSSLHSDQRCRASPYI